MFSHFFRSKFLRISKELCNAWDLPDPDTYALQFSDNNNQNYITEKNRNEIKNGSILRLELSPSKTASDILAKLNGGNNEERMVALEKLSVLSGDVTFAHEFINKKGLALIISQVILLPGLVAVEKKNNMKLCLEGNRLYICDFSQVEAGKCKAATLAFFLQSFVELMDHGIVSWDILETPFINKVASYVNNQGTPENPTVVEASLSILENIVLNSSGKYSQVDKELTFPNLVMYVQNLSPQIQQNAIALINALFLKADLPKRRAVAATLQSKQLRLVFLTNVIQSTGQVREKYIAGTTIIQLNDDYLQVGSEMAHQLYVLQTLMLGLLEQRMMLKMDPQDQDAHDKIKELRRIAFDTEGSVSGDVTARKQGLFAKDYKKLGFKYDINPALDFTETPPGMLALDCMVYFARNHTESYTKVVLENSCRADEHECPFGRTSVELVKLLCEVITLEHCENDSLLTLFRSFIRSCE